VYGTTNGTILGGVVLVTECEPRLASVDMSTGIEADTDSAEWSA
jgi:hypothetical protein